MGAGDHHQRLLIPLAKKTQQVAAREPIMPVPAAPKIHHIAHVDKLPSIITDGCLWCDAEIVRRAPEGTTVMSQGAE